MVAGVVGGLRALEVMDCVDQNSSAQRRSGTNNCIEGPAIAFHMRLGSVTCLSLEVDVSPPGASRISLAEPYMAVPHQRVFQRRVSKHAPSVHTGRQVLASSFTTAEISKY